MSQALSTSAATAAPAPILDPVVVAPVAFSEKTSRDAIKVTLQLLREIPPLLSGNCTVRLWDGTLYPEGPLRSCVITLRHPGSLRAMFLKRDSLTLAEAYLLNHFDVHGDIEPMFQLAEDLAAAPLTLSQKLKLAQGLLKLPKLDVRRPRRWRERAHLTGKPHSIERDKAAVAYHYNVATEFYEAFLDKNMVYSSALFKHEDESLDDAQVRKLDDICRQLKLQPGQRLLDVGCGWGGLMLHAAQHYGVEVTGITLSPPQAEVANRRIKEAGLADRCRALVCDYREIEEWNSFDAIASIEMFEHVGREMLTTYFTQAFKLLKPGGLFLNQGTTVETDDARRRYPAFIKSYIFPDGEVVPIHVSIRASEESGFEVLNLRSLRPHYVKTCEHWVNNLNAAHDRVLEHVGEPTWRAWLLYTGVSGHGFRVGRLNCYQTLMRRN
jgi:cyclopropane-fatty-acyl-phospholipid synthase